MPAEKKIIECVPNYSEGRDKGKIETIVDPFRETQGVKLLDYQNDEDHNRMVVTVIGDPDKVKQAVVKSIALAIELIDMRKHNGQHPRMGAVDVVPFIPVKDMKMLEAVAISKEVAKEIADKHRFPVFLYEASASQPHRTSLSNIRKGELEGMGEKLKLPHWKPDYGPAIPHKTAGVTAVGARMPLVAFNVNLNTNNLDIANHIAGSIRHINGGLRYCKAIGVELKKRGIVQVSMNMTDFTKTSIYRSFELIKIEAKRYGVNIVGSEIVGLLPMEALIDTAVYYMGIENFDMKQILESRLME